MATAATAPSDRVDAKKLLQVLTQYKRGDFSARMPVDQTGLAGKIYDTLNDVIEQNQKLSSEIQRISTVVGKAGTLGGHAPSTAYVLPDWPLPITPVTPPAVVSGAAGGGPATIKLTITLP